MIRPALDAGRSVICDRFVDSTAAYQGAARGLGVELVEGLNEIATAGCSPDVTLLLRIDPAGAEARGQQRLAAGDEDGSDRFEGEGIDFQRAVAAAYDELAARHPERIRVVDAEGSPGEVHERVMAAVGGARALMPAATEIPEALVDATEHQPGARAALAAALVAPVHAYLLAGPPGSGKRSAARAFAAELLAQDAP